MEGEARRDEEGKEGGGDESGREETEEEEGDRGSELGGEDGGEEGTTMKRQEGQFCTLLLLAAVAPSVWVASIFSGRTGYHQ